MKNKIMKVLKALRLIEKAYRANVSAHNSWGDQQQEYYDYKQYFIDRAISYIRKNRLPIKYGIVDNVVYFSFAGRQVSFHSFSRQVREKKIKKYDGQWSRRKNGYACPFFNIIFDFVNSKDEKKYEKFAQKYLYFPS